MLEDWKGKGRMEGKGKDGREREGGKEGKRVPKSFHAPLHRLVKWKSLVYLVSGL
jgi:hypothetical protein